MVYSMLQGRSCQGSFHVWFERKRRWFCFLRNLCKLIFCAWCRHKVKCFPYLKNIYKDFFGDYKTQEPFTNTLCLSVDVHIHYVSPRVPNPCKVPLCPSNRIHLGDERRLTLYLNWLIELKKVPSNKYCTRLDQVRYNNCSVLTHRPLSHWPPTNI